ncbi:MAG: DUF4038 domain-containing protein [Verrucomicrobiota bacterium]
MQPFLTRFLARHALVKTRGKPAFPRCLYACCITLFGMLAGSSLTSLGAEPLKMQANCTAEVTFTSETTYPNPFVEVTLDVLVTAPDGGQFKVPAFWAGGNQWRFRYASGVAGTHIYRTECSDAKNVQLHGVNGKIEIAAYRGENLLYQHGALRVAKDQRHFEHTDGTPFFWLGDTWWKGLCKRLTMEGFQELTADRKAKGFSVIQIVCGPYPDEGFLKPSWENEAGQPYLAKDLSGINPKYFDQADRRIQHLVDSGLVPAVVGAWGRGDCDAMQAFGAAALKRHWRYLVARYGAHPVVWIVAGEIADETKWGRGPWAEVAEYVRSIDPYHHPLTCHTAPGNGRRGASGDACLIDFDMVGGNHDAPTAMKAKTLAILTSARATSPAMPVLVGETCYEGHMQQGFQDVQRHLFWMYLLAGAAGHTYGAAGVMPAGVEGDHGNWGACSGQPYDWTTWKEGMNYAGSTQLGLGKKLLEKYPWWRFEPHPEWVDAGGYAAGIPGEVRIIYLPRRNIYNWDGPTVKNLEPDVDWHAYYFDPATGRQFDQGVLKARAQAGDATAQAVEFKKNVPSPQDWVLVLERVKPAAVAPARTDLEFADPTNIPPPPVGAIGQSNRAPDFDVLPGFRQVPAGFGNVAFYWWLGDKLTKERLAWQLDQLKDHSTSGLQINYAHSDKGGQSWGYTLPSDPPLFSEDWWSLTQWFVKEAKQRGMAVSLSDYTLGWAGQGWFVDEARKRHPGLPGATLSSSSIPVAGQTVTAKVAPAVLSLSAFNKQTRQWLDLRGAVKNGTLDWQVPAGEWVLTQVEAKPNPVSIDPMNPASGRGIIECFYQKFEDRNPGESGKGINFFFSDELSFGIHGWLWNPHFSEEFKQRKGYDVTPELAGLFTDIGPRTAKIRLDYSDVMVTLSEANYFKPIFDWHQQRGMTMGCDHGGRGQDPLEFGDYFRTQRWNQGPGADQPHLTKNLFKAKVASSMAHLYLRPRVWLEGFYGSGWDTTSGMVGDAILSNFAHGYNLLSFHGLYYSNHGGWWEWAPPCNHFHMPYWPHMKPLMRGVERLSYLMSQGHHRCDVAVIYPVETVEADRKGGMEAFRLSNRIGDKLYETGIDFDYMDFQSLARAKVVDKKLEVSGETYAVLVLPSMKAMRWITLQKALEFQRAGGLVVVVGDLPEASDRMGSGDPELTRLAAEFKTRIATAEELVRVVGKALPRDYRGEGEINHRRIGGRDVYMIYGASKGSLAGFRASGKVELWNPWDGTVEPLAVESQSATATELRLPLDKREVQLIVFSPGKALVHDGQPVAAVTTYPVDSNGWGFELVPTLDNRFGDYHWPPTRALIGAEARIFNYTGPGAQTPVETTAGFGPKLWVLGPVPATFDDTALQKLTSIAPAQTVKSNGANVRWTPYEFSWRWGKQNDPGHQGYHGLKADVSDEFLCLGKPQQGTNETTYIPEDGGTSYYIWTSVPVANETSAYPVAAGTATPDAIWVNGKIVQLGTAVQLNPGSNSLLARYPKAGRGYLVMATKLPAPLPQPPTDGMGRPLFEEKPLAMRWWRNPNILAFDSCPEIKQPVGSYQFMSPPGLKELVVEDAQGGLEVTVAGARLKQDGNRFVIGTVSPGPAPVTITVTQQRGAYAGAALPEYVRLACGEGLFHLGDWSLNDGLRCYSGGARYRKIIEVPRAKRVVLNLGEVCASAEVFVDGKSAGVRAMPPWTFDLTGLLNAGTQHQLEVLVYSALDNHYRTIPTHYTACRQSGLIGPVSLEIMNPENQ